MYYDQSSDHIVIPTILLQVKFQIMSTELTQNISPKELTAEQKAVIKALHIIEILKTAKSCPDQFPEKKGRVILSDFFKAKGLSKEEILEWQNYKGDWIKMTSDEFDELMPYCSHFYGRNDVNGTRYYFFFTSF